MTHTACSRADCLSCPLWISSGQSAFSKKRIKKAALSKEDIQMDSKYIKRCSTSLIIRAMQIQRMSHYLALVGMAAIKRQEIKSIGKDVPMGTDSSVGKAGGGREWGGGSQWRKKGGYLEYLQQ
uniref:Uncharacterized protein n=1 Tax=Molossus molossus TaxID=27622 RepID=A0A7J8ERU2_MOLMO|nr:hypothetical protein HJG59_008717 [Molossus molossus]